MSKKLIIVLLFVAAVATALCFYRRRPIIQLESVNYLGKRITYKMSCNGVSKSGAISYAEKFTAGGNGIELIGDNNGARYATFQIKKNGKLVKEIKVDFLKKAIEKGIGTWDATFGETGMGDSW